ncbi:MAG: hypothetical protein ACKOQ4_14015, partial [Mycobacterium sp.]
MDVDSFAPPAIGAEVGDSFNATGPTRVAVDDSAVPSRVDGEPSVLSTVGQLAAPPKRAQAPNPPTLGMVSAPETVGPGDSLTRRLSRLL